MARCIDEIADFIRASSTHQNADPPEAAQIVVAADQLAHVKICGVVATPCCDLKASVAPRMVRWSSTS